MNQPDDPLLADALLRLGGARTPMMLNGGQALPEPARSRLERLLGRSLTDVRIHDSEQAAAVARRLGADAVTVGRHIIGGSEQLDVGRRAGFALVAHEAAHVVQQLTPPPLLGAGRDAGDSAEPAMSLPLAHNTGPPRPAFAESGERPAGAADPDEEQARSVERSAAGGRRRRPQQPAPDPVTVADQVYRLMLDELRLLRERSVPR